jgi:hypothetical protein
MKSTLAFAAIALSALLTGCGAAPGGEVGEGEEAWTATTDLGGSVTSPTVGTTGSTSGTVTTANAFTPSRVYAFPAEIARCTTYRGVGGSWVGRFYGTAGMFAKMCVLEWIGSGAPDAGSLPSTLRTDTANKLYGDRPIVAPLGAVVDGNWKPLNDSMHLMAGEVGAAQTLRSRAFVGVVDSAKTETATDEASTGTYEHGEVVGRIAREVGGTSRALGVLSTLALPRNAAGSASSAGGYYGYTSDLALAIIQAVDAWRARTAGENVPRPLVVNLSLGWDSANYLGSSLAATAALTTYSSTSVTNYPQRSVFFAIQYANCAGALVLSAAGNKAQGSPSTNTLMLPAAWEAVPAPTRAQCEGFGVGPRTTPVTTSPRMTYAAGGVDGADKALFNTRSAGQPRIVAYGDAVAVSRDPKIGGHTGVMTGTSMSTAVASAIAAYGWSLRPQTNAHDVAAALYASGLDLVGSASACSYGAVCKTRRASRCELAAGLLGTPVSACATVKPFLGRKVKTGIDPTALAVFSKPTDASTVSTLSSTAVNSIVNPRVRPMPGSGGCSLCGIYADSAYLEIANPSYGIGATLDWGFGGISFTPSAEYMYFPVGGASFATITFTDSLNGWTSTEQLVFF